VLGLELVFELGLPVTDQIKTGNRSLQVDLIDSNLINELLTNTACCAKVALVKKRHWEALLCSNFAAANTTYTRLPGEMNPRQSYQQKYCGTAAHSFRGEF